MAKKKTSNKTAPKEKSKKLYRSKKNSMIAGVCGGIAEYANPEIDPTIIRLIWALLTILTGFAAGIILYIIAWIIIPLEK